MVEINKIDELIKEKGIKASFICSSIGKSESYLRQVRAGRSKIAENDLAIIADILGTTTDYLHGKTEQKEKSGISAELSISDIQFINRVNKLDPDLQRTLIAASQLDSEDLKALADIAERLVSSAKK